MDILTYGIFIFGALTVIKEILFWLYVVQLKEYRTDKIRNYFSTREGKKNLFSYKFFIRTCLLLVTYIATHHIFTPIIWIYYIVLLYVFLEALLFIKQCYTRSLRIPQKTWRIILFWIGISIAIAIYTSWVLYFLENILITATVLVLSLLLLTWIWVIGIWWLTNPLFMYKKKLLYVQATQRMSKLANMTKIGISWSYGKSSIKMLLTHIVSKQYDTTFPPDNINSELWVTNFILRDMDTLAAYFVTEFGTYAVWETTILANIVQHTHGFLTWLNNQHEALFGSLEQAISAETELIPWILQRWGRLYTNRDSQHVREYAYPQWLNLVRYGMHKEADALITDIVRKEHITYFTFLYKWESMDLVTDLIWNHSLVNLSGVLACCVDLWVKKEILQNTVQHLQSIQKTFHVSHIQDNISIIDDTYNINQNGIIAGIHASHTLNKPVIAVIDDIPELWNSSRKTHIQLGNDLANLWVSHIFLTWKEFASDIAKGLIQWWYNSQNIFILSTMNTKDFANTLQHYASDVTVVFLGRFTRPYRDLFII